MDKRQSFTLNRRDLLKIGGGLVVAGTAGLRAKGVEAFGGQTTACSGTGYIEVHPTSPLLLDPFTDPLPIPAPMAPCSLAEMTATHSTPPGPEPGRQDSFGGTHQLWPSAIGSPDPLFYRIKLEVNQHSFTTSRVQPILENGLPTVHPVTGSAEPTHLPASTIYGFNGTFPGPMIYNRYGQPSLVRFENHLDENPMGLDRCDFGAPDYTFLTHLHNAHTAPESDGNPHHRPEAYSPGQFVDNLYLNYPAGNDDSEKQSFFWFHDHKMDHTGADVYKGMVGLFPIYDPVRDPGNENDLRNKNNLRLPGVPNPITGRVDYDIPLVFYDCAFDDGLTPHKDFHNGCGETHPEWWGHTFFRHFPNHGFVGDVMTVNCTAYPVMEVKRRKYRLRFLDASIARCYELMFMSSVEGPVRATDPNPKKRQGQYRLPNGQQCMVMTEVATDGGLLPFAMQRNSVQVWPAKRREVVIDFTRYMDGSPTKKGDVIWLVNTLQMTTGRKPNTPAMIDDNTGLMEVDPDFEPNFKCPLMKIVIGDDAPDASLMPTNLRPLATINTRKMSGMVQRTFELQRGGFGGEIEWLINGLPFEPTAPLAHCKKGVPEIWTIRNGGGGWVHPMHLHYEEHRIISRNGIPTPLDPKHPDDNSREDVIALDPGEEIVLYRNFRTFVGKYVSHCHNLAHEDHAMMFGWDVNP